MMSEKISKSIYSVITETAEVHGIQLPPAFSFDSSIIGKGGLLDSLSFVSFLVAVEQKINQEYGGNISLNNERAFSQKKNPFRSINALAEYITEQMEKLI